MGAVACIVEGHGDVVAVPLLIRRVATAKGLAVPFVPRPVRVPRGRLRREEELHRAGVLAVSSAGGSAAVLVLADADDDCAALEAPRLAAAVGQMPGVLAAAAVFAVREYEAWFLASASSLAGRRGLLADLEPPHDPDGVRGAKEWLRKRMAPGRRYSETVDQPALTEALDLDAAMVRRSFRKVRKEIERLVAVATEGTSQQ